MTNYFINYTARPMEWIGSHHPDISMFVWAPVGRRQAKRQAKTAQKAKVNGIISQDGEEMTWDEFFSMVRKGVQIERGSEAWTKKEIEAGRVRAIEPTALFEDEK